MLGCTRRLIVFWLSGLLVGCGGGTAEPHKGGLGPESAQGAVAPSPATGIPKLGSGVDEQRARCQLDLFLARAAADGSSPHGHDHGHSHGSEAAEEAPEIEAFGDQELEVRAFVQVDENQWTEVARTETRTGPDGRTKADLPCGSRLEIRVPHWNWPSAPDLLLLGPSLPSPLTVVVESALELKLWVQDAEGKRIEEARFHSKDGGEPRPLPVDGLLFQGVGLGEELGEIRTPNMPPHPWTPIESDSLENPGPRHYEAILRLGANRSFVRVGEGVRHLSALWCLADGQLGERCSGRLGQASTGSFSCPCLPSAQIAFASDRWDVGILRTIPDPKDRLRTLERIPQALEVCPKLPKGAAPQTLRFGPARGLSSLSLATPPRSVDSSAKSCLTLPKGETLYGFGEATEGWVFKAEKPGPVEMTSLSNP